MLAMGVSSSSKRNSIDSVFSTKEVDISPASPDQSKQQHQDQQPTLQDRYRVYNSNLVQHRKGTQTSSFIKLVGGSFTQSQKQTQSQEQTQKRMQPGGRRWTLLNCLKMLAWQSESISPELENDNDLNRNAMMSEDSEANFHFNTICFFGQPAFFHK